MGVEQNILGDDFKTSISKKKLSRGTQKQKGITPQLAPNAIKVLEKRYLKKDLSGSPTETPETMFWRVAENISQADKFYDPKADTQKQQRYFMR